MSKEQRNAGDKPTLATNKQARKTLDVKVQMGGCGDQGAEEKTAKTIKLGSGMAHASHNNNNQLISTFFTFTKTN